MNREDLTAVIDQYVRAGLPVVYPSSLEPTVECSARHADDVTEWAHNFGLEPVARVEIQNLTWVIRQDLYVTVPLDGVPVMIRHTEHTPILGAPDARLVVVAP